MINLGNLISVLVISYPLRIWQFGYLAIDRNEQYDPKMFFLPLFSQNAKQCFCNLSYISFFIENVWNIRLFQIERMLTQAISVCRWSWKEDWAEFLIHHSTLATTAILLFNQIAFFMDQSPIIDDLSPLYWNSASVSLCANLVVLPGVNKKLSAC